MEISEMKKKFYEKRWFGILMLILVSPIGVFLIWKNKMFNKLVRVLLSIVAIPCTFIGLMFWIAMFNPKTAMKKSDEQVQARNEEASKSSDSQNEGETNASADDENTKDISDENGKSKNDDSNIEEGNNLIQNIYEQYKKSSEPKTEEFLRNPDSFIGKNIMYSGKIVQVLEGNDKTPTNIIIENSIDGQRVNILYDRKQGEPRYLEDDYITVLGTFDRIDSMKELTGKSIPMPIIDCKYIDFSYNISRMINACKAMDSLNLSYRLEMTDKTFKESNGKAGSLFKVYYLDTNKYDPRLLYSNGFDTAWYTTDTDSITEYFFVESSETK